MQSNEVDELNEIDKQVEKEKLEKLRKAIENLPSKRREIFVLSKFQGYKYKEIADSLKISIKTVEKQIWTAKKSLKENIT